MVLYILAEVAVKPPHMDLFHHPFRSSKHLQESTDKNRILVRNNKAVQMKAKKFYEEKHLKQNPTK